MYSVNNVKIIKIMKLKNRIFICVNRLYSDSRFLLYHSQSFSRCQSKRRLNAHQLNLSRMRTFNKLTDAKKEVHEKAMGSAFWKAWLNNASRLSSYYDQATISRVIGSFQFELPKTMPDVKDYIYALFTKQQAMKKQLESSNESKVKKTILNTSQTEISNPPKLKSNLQSSQKEVIEVEKKSLKLANTPQSSAKVTEKEMAVKKNDWMLSSASEAVYETFKNISSYLPRATTSETKDPTAPTVYTTVDPTTGQMKVRISCMETKEEAIERGLQGLMEQWRGGEGEGGAGEGSLMELCKYLANFPSCAPLASKEPNLIPKLLDARKRGGYEVIQTTNKALRLLGHSDPLDSKGIRVLSLDGGGTRGLLTIEILKEIERMSGRPIYELFNYVCGVSTGSLIGVMAFLLKLPLHQAESVYRHFSKKMFERNRLVGASKLVMTHAYYDTTLWEEILRKNIGVGSFVDSMSDSCHFSVVSTLMNAPRVQSFLFRNYNLPSHTHSRYKGSVEHRLWQAIRASSAAPGYFEEFELDGHVHQDGGVLTNNPTAIAIHEAKLIWPHEPIQCIVSIGTGWHEVVTSRRASGQEMTKSSLRSKIIKVIESATDTEGIHVVLNDFIPAPKYFRFNPRLSGPFELDETRDSLWRQMAQDTHSYCKKKRTDLEAAAGQLVRRKSRWELLKRLLVDTVKPIRRPFVSTD